MLNIGRMGPGSQRYYLDHVAGPDDGVQVDYYLQRGETPGRWLGRSIGAVGLSGQVTPEQLGRILDGDHPETGEKLASHPARKLPGLDLTFRAPKSVSLLWALTDDPDVAAAVQDAHDVAVTEAVGYLERHAVRSRRGAGGVETVQVDGLIAAAFRHRTSRAGDPLLHTHVLAANLARTSDDGVWRTLDSRRLFAHAKTAGTVYQASLRHQLTTRLSVSWQPVVNGTADLEGIDRGWIDAFSKRRAAIVRELARRGESSPAAAQVATLATRDAKPVQPTELELRAGWKAEARELGIPDGWERQVLGRFEPRTPGYDELVERLLGPDGVTAQTATFRPRDLVQAIANALPDGTTGGLIERLADDILDRSLDDGRIVPLGPTTGTPVVEVGGTPDREDGRFTTRGLLLTEQTAINEAIELRGHGSGVAKTRSVAQAISRRPTLSDEQAEMIRRLTGDGDGVTVVVGKAGTGKTYALDAAREAWETSGLRVTGVALAARAALELEESAGIRSSTLARLLRQLDDPASVGCPLEPGQVLVVDEAGMIGTRQLAQLLARTQRLQVKTVLVGDPRQLPEIDAGGLFAGLANRLPTIELADNRRQTAAWEQAALDDLRTGDVTSAIAEYRRQGRIATADTAEAIREQLTSDWWQTARQHPDEGRAVMVALRRADVDDLNQRARLLMAGDGRLTGLPVEAAGTDELQVGDRIVCLRNDRTLDVVNGTRATVTAAAPDGGVHVLDDHGRQLILPRAYLDAGHVTYGYAITGHKAQGLTVDHTFVLGSDALYRQWGYVAMSRGRETNRLYLHAVPDIAPDAHQRPQPIDPIAAATRQLQRDTAATPVSDEAAKAIADARRRLSQAKTWLARPEVRTAIDLHIGHDRDMRRYEGLEAEHDRLTAVYEQSGIALSRSARAQRRDTYDRLVQLTRDLDKLRDRILDTRTRLTGLPSPADINRVRDQQRDAQTTLDRLTRPARVEQERPTAPIRTWGITRGRGRGR